MEARPPRLLTCDQTGESDRRATRQFLSAADMRPVLRVKERQGIGPLLGVADVFPNHEITEASLAVYF